MIRTIKVFFNDNAYELIENINGVYTKTVDAPYYSGLYPVRIEITNDVGVVTIIDDTHPEWGEMLKLYVVADGNGVLIDYIPEFLKPLNEYKQIFNTEDIELLRLKYGVAFAISESTIMQATEERVEEWEQFLSIIKNGNLYQRKLYILATLMGSGKLDEEKIKSVVGAYTLGGGCIVKFEDSTIKVDVLPPEDGEIFIFSDIEKTLGRLKPAHIGLIVKRYYSTWGMVKDSYATWGDIAQLENWKALKNKIF